MKMLTKETPVLVIKNKTFAWLDGLSEQEKANQLQLAKNRSDTLSALFFQRQKAMNSLRLARLTVAKEDGLRRRMQAVSVRSHLTR